MENLIDYKINDESDREGRSDDVGSSVGPSQGHMDGGSSQSQTASASRGRKAKNKGPSLGNSANNSTAEVVSSSDDQSDAEMHLITRKRSVSRKRAIPSASAPGQSCSGAETDGLMPAKVSSAVRGRKKRAGVSREEFLKPSTSRVAARNGDESRNEGYKTVEDGSDTCRPENIESLDMQALRAQAGQGLSCILEVAAKSRNLKGEYVGKLKKTANQLQEIMDILATRTEAEELRRLRADNGRLRMELSHMRSEVAALRLGFAEAKAEAATAAREAAIAAVATPPLAPAAGSGDIVEEIKRTLTITLGEMLNARLANLEDRLLPAPNMRLPNAAGAKKAVAPEKLVQESIIVAPSTSAASAAVQEGKRKGTGNNKRKGTVQPATTPAVSLKSTRKAPTAMALMPSTSAPSMEERTISAATQNESWAEVVRKGKKGGGKGNSSVRRPQALSVPKPAPPVRPSYAAAAQKPARKTQPGKSTARTTGRLRAPRSAAVVITLKPAAAERGATYRSVLDRAQRQISLPELGISRVTFRTTATGARMVEISGSEGGEKADSLAAKLESLLAEDAHITRPVKTVDLRITGLDDAAMPEGVAAAVAQKSGCDLSSIRVGDIQRGAFGTGAVRVSCPITAAKAVLREGRLLIGWSSCRVVALEAKPLRCYRCMALGHVGIRCPATAAAAKRGDLCFRCGEAGHKKATCDRTELRCAVCADTNRSCAHIMGGRKCIPPTVKSGATINLAIGVQRPATQLASPSVVTALPAASSEPELVAMSD